MNELRDMKNLPLAQPASDFPEVITPRATHTILDSSKLKTYQTCPRQFFYEYILGWRRDTSNIHLVFGECWHDALEHILLNGYDEDSLYDAYQLFLSKFREHFPDPEQDELWFPKTPERAFQALAAYAARWSDDHENYDVLATEIAGRVTVTPQLAMTFRMDAIVRDRLSGYIIGLEHKTGSQLNNQWVAQWMLDYQPNLYLHAIKSHYGPDEAQAIIINGTFFTKNKGTRGGKLFEFHRERISKSNNQMNGWFQELHVWLELLVQDYEILAEASLDRPLTCFQRNPTSCTRYFGCAYHDFCVAWTNPLLRAQEPPPGFIVEHWDPTAREAKKVIEV